MDTGHTETHGAEEQSGVSDGMCGMCGRRRIEAHENQASFLCAYCQEEYSRLSVPLWVKGFFVALLAITVFALAQLPSVIGTYQVYREAQRQQQNNEFYPAMLGYLSVLEQYDGKMDIVLDAIDAAIDAQNIDAAVYIWNEYLAGKELNDAQDARASRIEPLFTRYYDTQGLYEDILEEQDGDMDGVHAALLGLLDRTDVDLDRTFLYFMLAGTTDDAQTRLEYLRLSAVQDQRSTYPLAYYGNELRRGGRFGEAKDVYRSALDKNAWDFYAMRGLGIVTQMTGDIPGGLQIIREACEMEPRGFYINEAMIIALCENDMRGEAMDMMELKLAEGYEFEPDLYEYLDGTVTMAEYYMN